MWPDLHEAQDPSRTSGPQTAEEGGSARVHRDDDGCLLESAFDHGAVTQTPTAGRPRLRVSREGVTLRKTLGGGSKPESRSATDFSTPVEAEGWVGRPPGRKLSVTRARVDQEPNPRECDADPGQ